MHQRCRRAPYRPSYVDRLVGGYSYTYGEKEREGEREGDEGGGDGAKERPYHPYIWAPTFAREYRAASIAYTRIALDFPSRVGRVTARFVRLVGLSRSAEARLLALRIRSLARTREREKGGGGDGEKSGIAFLSRGRKPEVRGDHERERGRAGENFRITNNNDGDVGALCAALCGRRNKRGLFSSIPGDSMASLSGEGRLRDADVTRD